MALECEDGFDEAAWERAMLTVPRRRKPPGPTPAQRRCLRAIAAGTCRLMATSRTLRTCLSRGWWSWDADAPGGRRITDAGRAAAGLGGYP